MSRIADATGLILTWLSLSLPTHAQSISGYVTDTSSMAVKHIEIQVQGQSGFPSRTFTNNKGYYSFKPLDPGSYTLTIDDSIHYDVLIYEIPVSSNDDTRLDICVEKISHGEIVDIFGINYSRYSAKRVPNNRPTHRIFTRDEISHMR